MENSETLSQSGIKNTIKDFIINNFLMGAESRFIGDDDSFLEQGIVDSTGVLELVSFVQEAFQIRIEDAELIPDNLDSLNNLEAFIIKKKQGQ